MNNIIVYGPGCAKCTALADVTKQAIYSRELLQTLRQTNTELSNNRSYRIYGAINKNEGLASFSMQECILVDEPVRMGKTV